MPRPPYLVATAWLLAVLVGVAAWFSEAWELTLWTAAGIAGALLLLALAALLAGSLARRLSARARGWPAWRLALGAVGARGGEALPVVLSLGLGLSVLAAIGQIDGNLRAAITADLPEIAPSYFVVDIQPDQIEDFRARMDANPAVERVEATPMLRGIITGLEGRPAEEVAPGHWTLQGDRGITYAAEPPPGTVLTEGAWWPADYTGPPFVSFAREEAEELGLGLGDAVTVNVLGRDLTATVASLREVDFQTAGLGFIMILNPSALAGAPHSWIATVYADPEADGPLLREIAAAYPNVTAISVRDVIGEASRIVEGVAAAVRVAAFAALATGFLVLLGAAAAGERARAWEAAVLKTLGASRRTILWSFALRAGLMGLAAGLVALGVGLLGSWAVTTLVMEAPFRIAWGNAAAIILGGTAATLAAGLLFALRPLAARPARILRARD
jgi:putative ABC transport system permease protein